MAHYLITGGAGFIGSHLVEACLGEGHHVTVIDDLSSGRRENLSDAARHPHFELIEARVDACPELTELVAAADVVFHLAATVGVFNVVEHPVETIENNIDNTTVLLRAAVAKRTRVIVFSTSEVYGKTTSVPFREDGDLLLGPPTCGRWSYAGSKLLDEFLALAYHQQFQVPATVVRPFNTIGPRQVGRYGMVVPRFISQALQNKPLTVFGDGRQSRCFTYVGDIVTWLMRLAERDDAIGQIFNLGNPREITIAELAQLVIDVTRSSSSIRYVPYSEAYGAGYEDMQRRVPDIAKVERITGLRAQVSLEDALDRTRQWLVAHPND